MKNLLNFFTAKEKSNDLLILTNNIKALEQSHGRKIGELEAYICKLQKDIYKLQQDVINVLSASISEHKESTCLNSDLNDSLRDALKTISRLHQLSLEIFQEQVKQKDDIIFELKKSKMDSKDALIKKARPNESLEAQKKRENIYEQVAKNDKVVKKKPTRKKQ